MWRAFDELHSTRQYTFGPQAILGSEISAWLDANEIFNTDTRLEFHAYLRAMDKVWMSWHSKSVEDQKKAKAEQKEPANAHTVPRNRRNKGPGRG